MDWLGLELANAGAALQPPDLEDSLQPLSATAPDLPPPPAKLWQPSGDTSRADEARSSRKAHNPAGEAESRKTTNTPDSWPAYNPAGKADAGKAIATDSRPAVDPTGEADPAQTGNEADERSKAGAGSFASASRAASEREPPGSTTSASTAAATIATDIRSEASA
jgi:hypothetical protein